MAQQEFEFLNVKGQNGQRVNVYVCDPTAREQIAELQELYEALTQSDIIVGTLPASGVANKIYRVPGTTSYSDYMWNGSQFVKMAEYNNGVDSEFDPNSDNLASEKATADYMDEKYLAKGSYDASTAVGLADNIRGDVYADEQFAVRMTGGEANEVGGIGVVQQLQGAGAAIVQMFPEGSGHDYSGDVSLDGTGGNAEAVVRYSNDAQTTEMGYLLCLEAFVSQTLSQAQLDAISAKDTGKADRDKAVWLTPAGAITSAPTIESGQTEVTFSGWRIAMRVKASEVRDASASSYWFPGGTKGRQVYDVAVAEGIEGSDHRERSDRGDFLWLANCDEGEGERGARRIGQQLLVHQWHERSAGV